MQDEQAPPPPDDLAAYLDSDDLPAYDPAAQGAAQEDAAIETEEPAAPDELHTEQAAPNDEVQASAADEPETATEPEMPPYMQAYLERSEAAMGELRAQNERLTALLERQHAPPPEPERPLGVEDAMRAALDLPPGPEREQAIQFASIQALEGRWGEDQAPLLDTAKRKTQSFLERHKRRTQRQEDSKSLREEIASLRRQVTTRDALERLSERLPSLQADPEIAKVMPDVVRLFDQPAALRGLLREAIANSSGDDEPSAVAHRALANLQTKIGALGNPTAERIQAVADYAAIDGKPGLAQALRAYAGAIQAPSNKQDDDPPKRSKKPATPRGAAGGKIETTDITDLQKYLEADNMDTFREYGDTARMKN